MDFTYKLGRIILVVTFALFVILILIVPLSSHWQCKEFDKLHDELNFHWSFWTGCLVKAPNDKWVEADTFLQYYGDLHTVQIGELE